MSGTEVASRTPCENGAKLSNSSSREDDIRHLREWLPKQPHLPHMSDGQLSMFLHSCYNSLEKAKKSIDQYYTIRNAVPELFMNFDPLQVNIQNTFKVVNYARLPQRTPKNEYAVYYCRLADTEPSKYDFDSSIKTFILSTDVQLATEPLAAGYVVVLDAKGVALGHISKINVTLLKKFLIYVQEAMPIRLKEIHVLNASSLVDKIYAIVKPFLKGELIDIIQFHSPDDMKSFYKHVPKDILPKDLGGKLGSIQYYHDDNKVYIEKHRDLLLAIEKGQKMDESKRPGQPKTQGEIFGVEGSFRKLTID